MQVEYYEPTRRDKLRAAASLSTPFGQKRAKRWTDEMYKVLEWRMKHEGFTPSEKTLLAYDEWKSSKKSNR